MNSILFFFSRLFWLFVEPCDFMWISESPYQFLQKSWASDRDYVESIDQFGNYLNNIKSSNPWIQNIFPCVTFLVSLNSTWVFRVKFALLFRFAPKCLIYFDDIANAVVLLISFLFFCCNCIEIYLLFIYWNCLLQP